MQPISSQQGGQEAMINIELAPDLFRQRENIIFRRLFLDIKKAAFQLLFLFGAGNETRTRDPDLGKVVLYQLSYSRILASPRGFEPLSPP